MRRDLRHGATLVEVLVVISIIIVVAAITYPAFSSAKERAHQEACASNLKQIHLAVKLYQLEYDGEGKYGDQYTMGLPHHHTLIDLLPKWICGGPPNELRPKGKDPYFYSPAPPEIDGTRPTWAEYAQQKQEDSILSYDINHNPAGTPLFSHVGHRFIKLGIGVRLSGQAVRKLKAGEWKRRSWWD